MAANFSLQVLAAHFNTVSPDTTPHNIVCDITGRCVASTYQFVVQVLAGRFSARSSRGCRRLALCPRHRSSRSRSLRSHRRSQRDATQRHGVRAVAGAHRCHNLAIDAYLIVHRIARGSCVQRASETQHNRIRSCRGARRRKTHARCARRIGRAAVDGDGVGDASHIASGVASGHAQLVFTIQQISVAIGARLRQRADIEEADATVHTQNQLDRVRSPTHCRSSTCHRNDATARSAKQAAC